MPVGALLVSVGYLKNARFVERFAEDLQTDRKLSALFAFREPARKADPANARKIGGIGENIGQIHLQRIFGALSNFEGRRRRSRRDEGIDFFECRREIFADQGADFLRAKIVRIVIAGAQHVSAENDAAFDFGAKTFFPSPFVMLEQAICIFRAISVPDAVETREIGRRFRRCDHVLNVDRVFGMRQRDLHDVCA
jgi:hypothetical protein